MASSILDASTAGYLLVPYSPPGAPRMRSFAQMWRRYPRYLRPTADLSTQVSPLRGRPPVPTSCADFFERAPQARKALFVFYATVALVRITGRQSGSIVSAGFSRVSGPASLKLSGLRIDSPAWMTGNQVRRSDRTFGHHALEFRRFIGEMGCICPCVGGLAGCARSGLAIGCSGSRFGPLLHLEI